MHNRHQERNEHHEHKPITHFEEKILMKIQELLTEQTSIKNQLNKAEAEIVKKVADLQAAIDELVAASANADLPVEVVDSLNEVKAAAESLDNIVPDETPVEPV